MREIAVPAVLVSILLVAGMFALMPVEKASTVHTAILAALANLATQSNTMKIVTIANTCTAADIAGACDVAVSIPDNTPFTLLAARAEPGGTFTGSEVIDPGVFTINGFPTGIDPTGATPTIPTTSQLSGGFTGIGTGGATVIESDMGHTIGTGMDNGDETIRIEIVLLLPGDAALPTVNFI